MDERLANTMPSHYTHLIFGRKVMKAMTEQMRSAIWSHKHCFLAGLQGPDPLFYVKPLTKNSLRQLGTTIHRESGLTFFEPARNHLQERGTKEEKSYVAGCICHYMLDSACHPFIDNDLSACGFHHLEIETELDSVLLLREGLDLYKTDPVAHLRPSPALAKAAAPFYRGLTAADMEKAFSSMKRYVPLTRVKNGVVRNTIKKAMLLSGMKEEDTGMLVEPSLHPAMTEAVAALEEKVWAEVAPTVLELEQFFVCVEEGIPLSDRFVKNFEGEVVAQ